MNFATHIFKQHAIKWDMKVKCIAVDAHNQNGIIEKGNVIIMSFYERINSEGPTAPVTLKVAHATFGKYI